MKSSTAGLTLIELLIGLLLVGVVMAALATLNLGTSRATRSLQAQNEMLSEEQTTINYMAGKLREAAYVFPNGSSFQLASSGNTLKDPNGSYVWNIGTDPMVAFVIPPRTVEPGRCATESAKTSGDWAQYCYAFYAFYAIKRSDLTADTGANSRTNNPGPDPSNDTDAWVLMEYRGYYTTTVLGYPGSGYSNTLTNIPGATSNGGSSGRLLMDYLPKMDTPPALFVSPASGTQVAGQTTVVMNIAAQQLAGGAGNGGMIRVPNTGYTTLTVYPRNIGKPQLLN